MKRGRPSKRISTIQKILEVINNSNHPLTILKIAQKANLNWSTTKKYLKELIASNQVKVINVSSGKKKLNLYVKS